MTFKILKSYGRNSYTLLIFNKLIFFYDFHSTCLYCFVISDRSVSILNFVHLICHAVHDFQSIFSYAHSMCRDLLWFPLVFFTSFEDVHSICRDLFTDLHGNKKQKGRNKTR